MVTDVYELEVQYTSKHTHWNIPTGVKQKQWSILNIKEWKIKK